MTTYPVLCMSISEQRAPFKCSMRYILTKLAVFLIVFRNYNGAVAKQSVNPSEEDLLEAHDADGLPLYEKTVNWANETVTLPTSKKIKKEKRKKVIDVSVIVNNSTCFVNMEEEEFVLPCGNEDEIGEANSVLATYEYGENTTAFSEYIVGLGKRR